MAFFLVTAVGQKTTHPYESVGICELINRRRFSRDGDRFYACFIHWLVDRKVSGGKLGYVNGAPTAFFGIDLNADFADCRIEARFLFGGVQNAPDRFSRFGIIIIKLFAGQLIFHHIKGGQEDFELILANQIQFQNSSPSEIHIHLPILIIRRTPQKSHRKFLVNAPLRIGNERKMLPFFTNGEGIYRIAANFRKNPYG